MHDADGQAANLSLTRLPTLLQSVDGWGTFRTGAKAAAVVAVIYRREGALYMPFVARRADLASHPGQVGLPGGRVEEGETAWAAGAREVEEEIGVSRAELVPLGAGPPVYAAVSNFSVVPFVASLGRPDPRFRADPGELDAVLEVPLDRLLDPSAWHDGMPWPGPNLPVGDAVIWGLTARLLAGLLPIIAAALTPAEDDGPGA
jgi:8-oxo-dGTP pyrophosphatase MutT (NUDIX family)